MDTKQLETALARLFEEENERIVFWNDPDKEFLGFMNSLSMFFLEGVSVVRLDREGAFQTKIRIEREEPEGKFLIYTPVEEPDFDDDWLLDIRLYSRSFRADRASIILDQLGLANQHLREHLAARRKFFDAKDRLQKLKNFVAADDTDADLDRKMIAVVVKADQPEWFDMIRTIFHAFTETNDEIDLDEPPAVWQQVEKHELDGPFWSMAKSLFVYTDDNPCLRNLLIRLLVTDFAYRFKGQLPQPLTHLVLPRAGTSNAVVCLAQWRDSASKGSSYDRLSAAVASVLHMDDHLCLAEIEHLMKVRTFLNVEQAIITGLRDRVLSDADTINGQEIKDLASQRQAGHWASPNVTGSPEVPRAVLHAVYDALVSGAEFFSLKNNHQQGFQFGSAQAVYHAYEKELFRFDQLYRHFCEAADLAEAKGWDVLKKLRAQVEASYVNWYVTNLALAWGNFVEPKDGGGLLKNWSIEGVGGQSEFFGNSIQPRLKEAERRRSFVVISDALRYEAAEELARDLNGKYRFEAKLSSQLGVVPSYTALGMAALLPHERLAYKPSGEVLADGKPTASFDQRNDVLASVGGLAVKADELLEMKKEQGREFIKDKRVVYIYHNTIDATGDQRQTEAHTFDAVRRAINEVASIVSYVINSLNGHHVVITADHGFLFTETAPGDPDKTRLEYTPAGTVRGKKRYLIGRNLGEDEAVWHGSTAVTAKAEGDMEFWIPRAANLFHFMGGARFVHGGATLQEIVVPVITVRHVKEKSVRTKTKTKHVTVHVLGTQHKITTGRHRFELIQMEPVSDRVKAITLKVAVYEGDKPVTNIESVTFDSSSDNIEDRKKSVTLTLRDRDYDKKTPYRLALRDAETGIEEQSVPVIIDRAFTDDF